MTEAKKPAQVKLKLLLWLIPLGLFLLSLLVSGLLLGGKYILMPLTTTSYQKKDCAGVERYSNILIKMYPGESFPSQLNAFNECSIYTQAVQQEQEKDWGAAHSNYQTYVQQYPTGILITEVREHDALVLLELVKEQVAQKQYELALKNLIYIRETYQDVPYATDAATMEPEVILTWGQELRNIGDFTAAETKFKELDVWARANVSQEYVTLSKRELAQTYFESGQALQSKEDYSQAIDLFNRAIESDPDPQAQESITTKSNAAIRGVHLAWGNSLAEKENYTAAMDHYQTYIDLSDVIAKPEAKDLVAGIYLKLSEKARNAGDFHDSLKKIKLAEENAGTDSFKADIETAQTDTFMAFANYEGGQAEQAMRDIGKQVCEKNKTYEYPIFGIDSAKKLFGLFGIETKLPAEATAKTPGAMHYIACIEIKIEAIQTKEFPILYNGYLFYNKELGIFGQMVREKYSWIITVRQTDTAEVVAKKTFVGGEPPALPAITRGNVIDILSGGTYQRYRGDDPNMAEVVAWLLSLVK